MKGILDGKFISPLETNFFMEEEKKKKEFGLIIDTLSKYRQSFSANQLEIVVSYEFDQLNYASELAHIKVVTLETKDRTVSVSYIQVITTDQVSEVFNGKVVTDMDEYKGFIAQDGQVQLSFSKLYERELDYQIPLDVPNNPEYEAGKITVEKALDWIDGKFCLDNEAAGKLYRHCGPGCGDNMGLGGGTPINSIDSCCRAHDRCWINFGNGDKCCDKTLASCIDPYQNQDYWSWLQINSYFQPRGWLC